MPSVGWRVAGLVAVAALGAGTVAPWVLTLALYCPLGGAGPGSDSPGRWEPRPRGPGTLAMVLTAKGERARVSWAADPASSPEPAAPGGSRDTGNHPSASPAPAWLPAGAVMVEIHAAGDGLAARGWYRPADLRVPPGTRVVWVNRDVRPHSVTAADGAFDSGLIPPGGRWAHRFERPGEYRYDCYRCFCNPMGGRVVVSGKPSG